MFEKTLGSKVKGGVKVRKLLLVALLLALVPAFAGLAQHKGLWPDEMVFFEETDQSKVLAMMQTGDAHLYGNGFVADLYQEILDSGLPWTFSYGSFNVLLLNPAGDPFFTDGRFNPFGLQQVREGMTYLIDRDFIVEEINKGLAVYRVTMLDPNFPPYSQAIETARAIELKYAYNPTKGEQMVTDALTDFGCEKVDGKWMYDGDAVEIVGIIRTEDERKVYGDYYAGVLEGLGFTVDRQFRTSAEASPIWLLSDPAEGQWNYYTGGWISNLIDRDQGGDYDFQYTPRGWAVPLNQGFPVTPEADAVFDKLARRDYASIAERVALLGEAETYAQELAWQQWLYSAATPWAWAKDVSVLVDVAAGISGAYIWAHTARFVDADGAPVVGGTMRMASPSMLTQPWNPVAGSNWLYDAMIQRAGEDWPLIPDPYTGLYQPHLITSATVTAVTGTPIGATLDYVTVDFQDEIVVPGDAWVDWDAAGEVFITADEKFPGGLTAKTKTTATFDENLFTYKWHDGSLFSIGDMLMVFILGMDVGKPESAIYDEAQVPSLEQFLTVFKGARIVSTAPLTIEVYDDRFYLDAEAQVFNRILANFWPNYSQGMAPWHTIAAGYLAEAAEETCFSEDKADRLGVDRMNFIAGPTLEILKKHVAQAKLDNFVPYLKTMFAWIDPGEIYDRYVNFENFLAEYGHIWISNGPLMLKSVDTVAKIVVGIRFEDYAHDGTKWLGFAEPKFGDMEIEGPDVVTAGDLATFDVTLDFKGEAYPANEIMSVKYLVFDATGALAFSGEGEVTGDGTLKVEADTTGLAAGSAKIEIIAVLIPVAKPSTASYSFIVQ